MPYVMTRIGNGTNRSIRLTPPDTSFTLFTWDTVTGDVTSGEDSNDVPFFNASEVANLTQAIRDLLAVVAAGDLFAGAMVGPSFAGLVAGISAMNNSGFTPQIASVLASTTVTVTLSVNVPFPPFNKPQYFMVNKPWSAVGSLAALFTLL